MTGRIPQVSSHQLIRACERLGFVLRRTTGSHAILRHPTTKRFAVVPLHSGDVKRGLLFGILKQAEISPEELLNVL